MQWWAGVQVALGFSLRESTKLFFLKFGVDVLTAQTYGVKDSEILLEKINKDIQHLTNKHGLKL